MMNHPESPNPEFFAAIVDASPVAMIVVDLSGRVLSWNPAAERLFGWSAADAIGRIAPHVPAEQQPEFFAWLAVGRQEASRRDLERVRKDGSRLRLRILTAPIRNAQGQVIGILGMHTDLSDQLLAEVALDRHQKLLQTIIDNIPVMIGFFDANGRFLLVNRAWERLLGWDVPAMNAQPDMMALFYPDPAYRQAALEYMQAGTAEWRPFTTVTRSGTAIEAVWANVHLPDGTSIGIGQNVTALQRQAEALQHQLDLMHLLLESIPFGYIYAEAPSGTIQRFNSQAEQILGHAVISAADPDAYGVHRAYHADGRPYAAADYPIAQVLHSGTPVSGGEMRYLRGDGRWITLRNSAMSVRNSQGAMVGVIHLFEDMTERLQLEERFLQAQKLESIGRLAGGIAHDFNNLLLPIIGYVDLGLHSLPADSPLSADLQQIRYAAERAADLTHQILAFSRRQILAMRSLDLNALVADLQKMLVRLIGEDVALQARFAPHLPLLYADKSQIEQVLLNLVVNARDAMPSGGTIMIETLPVTLDQQYMHTYADDLQPGPYLLLAVSDTGFGMDAATRNQIFEPFFTTKSIGKGTGLGLATVFGIVKQHQGFIVVHSAPQRGAVFKIYLPQQAANPTETLPPPAEGPFAVRPTVLVVEADTLALQGTVEALHALGCQVLQATNAAEALQSAAGHPDPIRLLITPPQLPDHDGSELHRRLVSAHRPLPVLYLTADPDFAPEPHPAAAGTRLVLHPPFAVANLIHAVRSLLPA